MSRVREGPRRKVTLNQFYRITGISMPTLRRYVRQLEKMLEEP